MHEKKEAVLGIGISLFLKTIAVLYLSTLFCAIKRDVPIPDAIINYTVMGLALSFGTLPLLYFDSRKLSFLFWGDGSKKRVLLFGLLGAVLVAFINNSLPIFGFSEFARHVSEIKVASASDLIPIIYVGIFGPFLEEIYYRGCIFRFIRDSFDIFWASIVSAAFFIFAHNLSSVEQQSTILFACIVFTFVYQKTNSVLASGLAHSIGNLVLICWAPKAL